MSKDDVGTLIQDFITYCQFERLQPVSEQTLKTYKKRLAKIAIAWQGKQIQFVTEGDVKSYRADIIKRGCNVSYANTIMVLLRSFFRYCREERKLEVLDPGSIKIVNRLDSSVRYLRPEEINRFIRAINVTNIFGLRLMAFVTTLLDSGMRINEVLSLNRQDVEWASKTVFLRGKGGKERIVFMREWSLFWLKAYLDGRKDEHEALFVTHNPQNETLRLVDEDMRRYFRVIGKIANVPNAHPHLFRKTYATYLHANGADMRFIQHLLGHSKITTTEHYVGKNVEALRRVHSESLNYGKAEETHMGVTIKMVWTKNNRHQHCVACRKKERPHAAKGLCYPCYMRRWRRGTAEPKLA